MLDCDWSSDVCSSDLLRLDVAALRDSPIADVLRDGQRRGGLFRSETASRFDPVDGLDAVASTAQGARLGDRGVTSDAWSVVALVRRAHTPREVVSFAVLGGSTQGGASGWIECGPYSVAEFASPWQGHRACVGASQELIVLPSLAEPRAQTTLVEQLASPASPIDPVLVFDPGKLGEVRLAMPGLPLGIATIHLTGASIGPSPTMGAGILLEGELVPSGTQTTTSLAASLEGIVHGPATSALLQGLGLAPALARISFQETASEVRVTARLEWIEVGRIVELITDTTTGTRPESPPPRVIGPPPPPG
jgi:hypothetical protein